MSIKATATWTSATALNTTLVQSVEDTTSVLVTVIVSGTITAGQINFEASDDGVNWYSMVGLVQSTFAIFTNWQASFGSPVSLQYNIAGFTQFRLRLATVLTGSGNVTVNITNEVSPFLVLVSAVQQNGANLAIGGRAATSNPSNTANASSAPLMTDKAGRLVVTPGHVRDLTAIQTTAISASTAETTIITAGGAGVFNDLTQLIITTNNAAAGTITIKDATAGTTRMILDYPNAAVAPSAPIVLNFEPPIPQAVAANNWTATCSVNAGHYEVTAVFIKNT